MNIDKLKKVVVEANPSIMELQMGCRVKVANNLKIIIDVHTDITGTDWNYIIRDDLNQHLFREVRKEEIGKYIILGRPITLEDIMKTFKQGILVDTIGIFYDIKKIKPLNIGRAWKIGLTLDNQSDETLTFLSDLLV